MIKAIIFDCFGVLTTDGWHPFKNKYFAHDSDKAKEATKLNGLANSGQIEFQQFLNQVGDLAGLSAQQVHYEISRNVANEKLFEYIKGLAVQYKIGMLSNAAQNWLGELFGPTRLEFFDGIVLSCDIGVNKPQKGAYEAIASKLNVRPEECIFVDDLTSYLHGAEAVGMTAIQYTDFDQFKTELEAVLKNDQSE